MGRRSTTRSLRAGVLERPHSVATLRLPCIESGDTKARFFPGRLATAVSEGRLGRVIEVRKSSALMEHIFPGYAVRRQVAATVT